MTVAKWARHLNLCARRRWPEAAALPPLILITDRHRQGDPMAAAARLPRGACVLLRDYDDPDRAVTAKRLARLCRRHGLVLLIAGDRRLTRRVMATGLHLSEPAMRRKGSRRGRPHAILTAAAHGAAALRRAARGGVDAALLSPVFPTASHPGGRALGAWRFARLAHDAKLPVYALGGVDRRSARRLIASGACGIAAVGALAPDYPGPDGAAIRRAP